MKIGIVAAGGMSRGVYEIGCLRAIAERFDTDEIAAISASSIGTLVSYSFASGKLDKLTDVLKSIETEKAGRFFPSYSGNTEMIQRVRDLSVDGNELKCPVYTTVWNYTEKSVRYIPMHKLTCDESRDYLCAAVAIPIFNKGVRINKCVHFDGAFIDNIPVSPMLEQNIDVIFCIYFDNQNYFFENEAFDRKLLKLYDFPACKRLDGFTFDPKRIDNMIDYGYEYTNRVIDKIFKKTSVEDVYASIEKYNSENADEIKKRITCDTIITNLNKMTSRFAKRNIL